MASGDQLFCDPCSRGDTVSSGYSRCSDCEEILCAPCDKAHRISKLTLSHYITNIQDLTRIPKEPNIQLRFCDNHPEKNIDFYCVFHDAICCQTCILESHRACEQISLIDDVCDGIKSSALVEDVSKAVSSLLRTYDSVIENRKTNKELIYSQETIIKESIVKLKQCLLEHVDTLEQSLLADLTKLKEETVKQLDAEITESKLMSENWQKTKLEFDFNVKHGSNSQLFRLVEKLKNQISEEERKLQDKLANTLNVDVKYVVREDSSNIISALAAISLENQSCSIEHVSQMQKNAQFVPSMLSLTLDTSIDLSSHGISSISGIEVTSDNKLLLCSYIAKEILQYNDDGTLLKKKALNTNPYQIQIMPNDTQAAVTMPFKSGILIIDSSSLASIREIDTEKKYFAILTFNNSFVVGGNVLDMITMDGKVNRTIEMPQDSSIRCIVKRRDDTLLYTNYFKLYCIRLFDGSSVFEYTATEEARGIDEDRYGCIYVADKTSKRILRLAPDGSLIDTIESGNEEGIGSPLALRFSPDYSKLYVGLNENKMVLVYKCK
ncbi:Hypothetical predicted protein [Mytilus galloprovincialis]|uniref:B box-type domain-containing protein n=1 Tax=Mytilus galloprovincialis TaxID=29158 RepID=A0A8B6GY47_MYTGA|nr:Hypothetical predicted protein [Mytilus galloprovincialis]